MLISLNPYTVCPKKGYTNVRANNFTKDKDRLIIFLKLKRIFSCIWFVKFSDNPDANLFCSTELKRDKSGTVLSDLCNQPSMLNDCIRTFWKHKARCTLEFILLKAKLKIPWTIAIIVFKIQCTYFNLIWTFISKLSK